MREWALITGASSGIGRAFAQILGSAGWNLYLVARTTEKLVSLAESLSEVEVIPITADLSTSSAAQTVFTTVENHGPMPSLVINNAGVGYLGSFRNESLEEAMAMMHLNMDALVMLTSLFLPSLCKSQTFSKRCGIINVASISMAFPIPYMAIYGATKAFVNSFTLALAQEHPSLHITSMCPGPVATNFGPLVSKDFMPHSRHRDSAEAVAKHAYKLWLKKRPLAIFALRVKFLNILGHILPRNLAAWISGKVITQNKQ